MCAFNHFQCLHLTHYSMCFYRHLPQLGGQQKFPELIAGASGGMLIPTAVTQCTYVCCVCAHMGMLKCGCVHDEIQVNALL